MSDEFQKYRVEGGQLVPTTDSWFPEGICEVENYPKAMREAGWLNPEGYPNEDSRFDVWKDKDGRFIVDCTVPYDNCVSIFCENVIELLVAARWLEPYFSLINSVLQWDEGLEHEMERERKRKMKRGR